MDPWKPKSINSVDRLSKTIFGLSHEKNLEKIYIAKEQALLCNVFILIDEPAEIGCKEFHAFAFACGHVYIYINRETRF